MIRANEIIQYIKKHRGETITYGRGYSIQVYDDWALQANISCALEKEAFIKIEQREEESINIFLEEQNNVGQINYLHGCKLAANQTIADVLEEFNGHPKIEKAMIALLELNE